MKKTLLSLLAILLLAAGCSQQLSNNPASSDLVSPNNVTSYSNSESNITKPSFDENTLLSSLSPVAQKFFKRSMAIRATYAENNAYKYFQRDRDGDGKIDVLDKDGYLHLKPINNDYVPNSDLYGDKIPASVPAVFYRYVKDCKTRETIERQIIDSTSDYKNYIGADRYQEQCVSDGSADEYYLESKAKLE